MPIYEFQCSDGHLSEKRLPLTSEEREADCPDCGLTAHRIISAPFTRRVDAAKAVSYTHLTLPTIYSV